MTSIKQRAQLVLSLLKTHYPHAKIILTYENNWELLAAVILSAQCTDVMVNKVTSKIFPKYRKESQSTKLKAQNYNLKFKTLNSEIIEILNFAIVNLDELDQDIKSTGFYKNKAKNIQAAAKVILEKFNGHIPQTMEDMLTVPGVGRKTANVVLGNAYGIVEGIAVDTHVKKQAQKFGFTKQTTPDKIEQDLMKLFPKKEWFPLTYLLIEHGRAMRKSKKTPCKVCIGDACSLREYNN